MAHRVVFLYSDTGGGHRASATAVKNALEATQPGRFEIELLDPFVETSRPLLRWIVYRYSWMLRNMPRTYGLVFHLTDNRALMRTALGIFGRQFRPGFKRDVTVRQPDAIVSFHPLTNHVVLETLSEAGLSVPFITVVTDMTELHGFWMARAADLVIVASPEARRYAISKGLDPRRVHAVGLPVNPAFTGPLRGEARAALRGRLGLRDQPTLLMASGGEGSGRLGKQAIALDRAGLGLQLLVVCGRNERLRERLARRAWQGHVRVYGFVDNMPELMQAADGIVTKAGPGTITEALITGLPIFITTHVPGQEAGNVTFVEENQVGWHVPRTRQLVKKARWAFGPGLAEFERTQGRAEAVGRPHAAEEIAALVAAAAAPPPGRD